jgi:hypothetical protein
MLTVKRDAFCFLLAELEFLGNQKFRWQVGAMCTQTHRLIVADQHIAACVQKSRLDMVVEVKEVGNKASRRA